MKPFIYLRSLRRVEHTVFSVQEGQKFYRDPIFNTLQAYASGQQVKRCIMDSVTTELGVSPAPITFNWKVTKKGKKSKTGENTANDGIEFESKEAWSPCNPAYVDQLIGGYMRAQTGESVIKRRSPLSVSAMRPVHPLLGGMEKEKENLTFDRTSHPDLHPVRVTDDSGEELSPAELSMLLAKTKRNLPNRLWVPDNTRVSGLFANDVCIDLRTLFCVSMNQREPEMTLNTIAELKEAGWIESKNVFGACLVAPKAKRDAYIDALAEALIGWRITSNQARTFSLMETIAVAISTNPDRLATSIRGELRDDVEYNSAKLVISKDAGADVFVSPLVSGIIKGEKGEANALYAAEQQLVKMMKAYDYENQ